MSDLELLAKTVALAQRAESSLAIVDQHGNRLPDMELARSSTLPLWALQREQERMYKDLQVVRAEKVDLNDIRHTVLKIVEEGVETGRVMTFTTRSGHERPLAQCIRQLQHCLDAADSGISQINKSLVTLGLVISKLAKQKSKGTARDFIPYRDSKLTRILQVRHGVKLQPCLAVFTTADAFDSSPDFANEMQGK